ncbi:hypothetical protein [Burkholderia sp. BCC0097]|uniref:hypothetical protein n=1 Tax=Burkholderia sp. BCC0097 TaxID=2676289 RepID=UPI00158E2E0F|nr:hypothetical protein [Burkholderia sp. BCC0097]
MNPGSIDNWFALPPPRAASYLPMPYGVRRGVPDRFKRLLAGAVYLPTGSVVAAEVRAADFGHDNLAWSRKPPKSGLGRAVSVAIGGVLLGAALTAVLGTMLADRGAAFGRAVPGRLLARTAPSASVAAVASAAVPVPNPMAAQTPAPPAVSTSLPTPAASRSSASSSPARGTDAHAVPPQQRTPLHPSDTARSRGREAPAARPGAVRPASPREPATHWAVKPGDSNVSDASDNCRTDWPCGNELQSLQAELKRWDARKSLPASGEGNAPEMSARLNDHRRVAEW